MVAFILLGLMAHAATQAERPPRPSDEQLVQRLMESRPGARVLDRTARDVRNGGRVICGRFRMDGQMEPFAAYAMWEESSRLAGVITSSNGPLPVEPDHWQARVVGPVADHDDNGVRSLADQNYDALQRRLALSFCPLLTPPDGISWPTNQERPAEASADLD